MEWMEMCKDWVFPRWCIECQAPAWGEEQLLGACWACEMQCPDLRGVAGRVLFQDRVFGLQGRLGFRLTRGPDMHALVHRIKYGGDRSLSLRAGRWLARGNRPDGQELRLVPVPLHWRREWKRGYNQAEGLASGLAMEWKASVERRALKRVVHRVSLTGSSRLERQRKLHAVFHAAEPRGSPRVWLVDDVLTTGATLRACSQVLEQAGWEVQGAVVLALA